MTQPVIKKLIQVCLVVNDFDETIKGLAEQFGIGPWKCWHYQPPAIFAQTFRGKEADTTMKLGVAWVGDMQLEVIQPVGGQSVYREYLETQGEGVQHLHVVTESPYAKAIQEFEAVGFPVVQGSRINPPMQIGALPLPRLPQFLANSMALQFVYHDTKAALKTILETSKMPPGISFRMGVQLGRPDYWAPADSKNLDARLPNKFITRISKIGLLTSDLAATKRGWESVGVGPWEPRSINSALTAIASLGSSNLEIVMPTGPGLLKQLLDKHGEGVQYLGIRSEGMTQYETIEKFGTLGYSVLEENELGVFVDTREAAKTIMVL